MGDGKRLSETAQPKHHGTNNNSNYRNSSQCICGTVTIINLVFMCHNVASQKIGVYEKWIRNPRLHSDNKETGGIIGNLPA
jgi:hypothetical protein